MNSNWIASSVLAAVAFASGAASTDQPPGDITARSLTIVDEEGKPRIELGFGEKKSQCQVVLRDPAGQERLMLTTSDGHSGLALFSNGEMKASLSSTPKTTGFYLLGPDGHSDVSMNLMEGGTNVTWFGGDAGKKTLSFSTWPELAPTLSLSEGESTSATFSPQGAVFLSESKGVTASLSVSSEDRPSLTLQRGKQFTQLAVMGDAQCFLKMTDAAGRVRSAQAIGAEGTPLFATFDSQAQVDWTSRAMSSAGN